MNKGGVIIAGLALAASLASCGYDNGDTSGKTVLMVSIEPQRYILEQLVDSTFEVQSLLGRGANPETFDPSTSQRRAVDQSALYFATGVLPFEQKLAESAHSTEFVSTAQGVELLYGTHGHSHAQGEDHGHSHDEADPHYWSSVEGGRAIAKNMAEALSKQYPQQKEQFGQRLESYNAHLDSLENYLNSQLSAHEGESYAVWHPSLSYFAKEFGLNQLSLGLEGKEMSAQGLGHAIDEAREHSVKVFFFQKEYDLRQAETINSGIGSRMIMISPLEYDWESQLKLIADEIARP